MKLPKALSPMPRFRTKIPRLRKRPGFPERISRVSGSVNSPLQLMRCLIGSLSVVLLVLSCGCNRGEQETRDGGRPRIALVVKTLNSPFFLDMERGAQARARELNVEVVVQAAEREIDVEKQMQIVENLIQTRVDVLCVAPSGSKELVPAIGKANQAKIPVIIVDTRLDEDTARADGVTYQTFIGSDNYQGGKIAGEYIGHQFTNKTRFVVLEGIPGHETGDNRLRGFRDGIAPFDHVEVVASQPANWERDQGYNVMQNLLQANRTIDGVFACNDVMALGAMEAIAAAGMSERIKVLGFDAVGEARKEIAAGNMEASVAQNPELMGRLAIENAVKILQNETIASYIPVDIQLITRENAGPAPGSP